MVANEHSRIAQLLKTAQCVGMRKSGTLRIADIKCNDQPETVEYITLDEALRESVIEITEVTESGSVPTLRLVNRSNRMVFLMAGELLVGCKQDRVLNTSLMVAAENEMTIPVTCVEAGRWRYRSSAFSSGGSSSHSMLRMAMLGQTHRSYRERGMPGTDQRAVWQEVERKIGVMNSSSASSALETVYRDYSARLESLVSELPAAGDCNGAVFARSDEIIGCDLFDKPATLMKLWPKLIKSYAIDAFEAPRTDTQASPRLEEVSEWLKAVGSTKTEEFQSPGVGKDLRMSSEEVVGAALVVDNQPVHIACFREKSACRQQS